MKPSASPYIRNPAHWLRPAASCGRLQTVTLPSTRSCSCPCLINMDGKNLYHRSQVPSLILLKLPSLVILYSELIPFSRVSLFCGRTGRIVT